MQIDRPLRFRREMRQIRPTSYRSFAPCIGFRAFRQERKKRQISQPSRTAPKETTSCFR